MDVERVLCLTATATESVAKDVCDNFFINPKEGVFRIPVYRPKCVIRVCQRRLPDNDSLAFL